VDPAAFALSERSREVGVATEMLLTKSEQVSATGRAPPDYAYTGHGGPMAAFVAKHSRDPSRAGDSYWAKGEASHSDVSRPTGLLLSDSQVLAHQAAIG
jgi:hypothetical protein